MLFSIDLDGTLLRSDYSISEYTQNVIRDAMAKGHRILLSSGRPPRAMLPYYSLLGLSGPMACYNGALVYDPKDGSFPIKEARFSKDWLIALENRTADKLECLMCESKGKIYANKYDEVLDHFFPYKGMEAVYGPLSETLKEDCYTALFRLKKDEDQAFLKAEVEKDGNMLYRSWRNSPYAEAYIQGIDKGSALTYIQRLYGITQEETIAIGDSSNDIPMFRQAGKGYLVKNGTVGRTPEEGHYEKASFANDEDAVGRIISSLI